MSGEEHLGNGLLFSELLVELSRVPISLTGMREIRLVEFAVDRPGHSVCAIVSLSVFVNAHGLRWKRSSDLAIDECATFSVRRWIDTLNDIDGQLLEKGI